MGAAKAEAARVTEYLGRAAERQVKRTGTTLEGENEQQVHGETTRQTDEDMPVQGSGGSSSGAMGASRPDDVEEQNRTDKSTRRTSRGPGTNRREVDASKGKTEDEGEESRLKKTIKYLKKLAKTGGRGDCRGRSQRRGAGNEGSL